MGELNLRPVAQEFAGLLAEAVQRRRGSLLLLHQLMIVVKEVSLGVTGVQLLLVILLPFLFILLLLVGVLVSAPPSRSRCSLQA